MNKRIDVIIVGFGNVGRALFQELTRYKEFHVAGLASSKGAVLLRNRESFQEALNLAEKGFKLDSHSSFHSGMNSIELAVETGAELAFIAIPPSYESGEPNRSLYYGLLDNGLSIITADKTVLALEYRNIKQYVQKRGLFLGYRATVAAGTPVLDVIRGLKGREISLIRAVLNATTNYILSLIEKGLTYKEAISKAIEERLAEPNPYIDIDGWDPAAKLAIMLSEIGIPITIHDVYRESLETILEEEIRYAVRRGYRIKYIAEAIIDENKYSVHPMKMGQNDRLAAAYGYINIVEFYLENEK